MTSAYTVGKFFSEHAATWALVGRSIVWCWRPSKHQWAVRCVCLTKGLKARHGYMTHTHTYTNTHMYTYEHIRTYPSLIYAPLSTPNLSHTHTLYVKPVFVKSLIDLFFSTITHEWACTCYGLRYLNGSGWLPECYRELPVSQTCQRMLRFHSHAKDKS